MLLLTHLSLLSTFTITLIFMTTSTIAGSVSLRPNQPMGSSNGPLIRQQTTTNLHQPGLPMHAMQQPFVTIQTSNSENNPYSSATHSLLWDLRQQLITKALKFDEHFRNLLSSSKINLHNMFVDTYGTMYQQNSEIFTSMYESLEQYYATGQIQLTKSMQDFFVKLYQKIFQAYHLNRIFTAEYMACATEQLEHLKPFKDAPEKLIGEIRHAFVAARAFNQALNSGIDVLKSIMSLERPKQYTNLINERLLKHADGMGQSQAVPCLNYCKQVISRGIGPINLEEMNKSWKLYVQNLAELAKKLSVHYNIETIIEPLDLQISEAIMNFQDNATDISAKVSRACGPSTGPAYSASLIGPKITNTNGQSMSQATRPTIQQNRLGKRAAPAPTSVANMHQRNRQGPNSFHQFDPSAMSDDLMGSESSQQQKRHKTLGSRTSLSREDIATSPTATSLLGLTVNKKKPIIVDEIRDFMLSTRSFWENLPNSTCTIGLGVGGSQKSVLLRPPHCFEKQLNVSDMNSDIRYREEIEKQAKKLNQTSLKITNASYGVEIDWTNSQTTNQESSSSSFVPAIGNSRPSTSVSYSPSPSSPPTASTSGEDEADEDDEWNSELGSGDGNGSKDQDSNSSNSDDGGSSDDSDYQDGDEPGLEATPGIEDDYPSSSNNNGDNDDATTQQPPNNNEQQATPPDNSLDTYPGQPPRTQVNLDISNDLITAADAQKSSASELRSSSVIFSCYHLMLLLSLLLSQAHVNFTDQSHRT